MMRHLHGDGDDVNRIAIDEILVIVEGASTPNSLPAASADARWLADSAVISKSSDKDLSAGMCAWAAHPPIGIRSDDADTNSLDSIVTHGGHTFP
jgi:hypothetical protein